MYCTYFDFAVVKGFNEQCMKFMFCTQCSLLYFLYGICIQLRQHSHLSSSHEFVPRHPVHPHLHKLHVALGWGFSSVQYQRHGAHSQAVTGCPSHFSVLKGVSNCIIPQSQVQCQGGMNTCPTYGHSAHGMNFSSSRWETGVPFFGILFPTKRETSVWR